MKSTPQEVQAAKACAKEWADLSFKKKVPTLPLAIQQQKQKQNRVQTSVLHIRQDI